MITKDTINTPLGIAVAVAERIGVNLPAEEVWLFGSHARGDARDDSDLDFVVIVPESSRPNYQRSREAHFLVRETRIAKDIVVLTREQWAQQEDVVNTIPFATKREGRILYRR